MKDKKILLAEDERIIALDLMYILSRNGFNNVSILADGNALLNKAVIEGADLIITDILFNKDMDGINAVETIWGKIDIPVIFISGLDVTLDTKLTLSNFVFLKKPFRENEVLEAIYKLLNNS